MLKIFIAIYWNSSELWQAELRAFFLKKCSIIDLVNKNWFMSFIHIWNKGIKLRVWVNCFIWNLILESIWILKVPLAKQKWSRIKEKKRMKLGEKIEMKGNGWQNVTLTGKSVKTTVFIVIFMSYFSMSRHYFLMFLRDKRKFADLNRMRKWCQH